MRVVFHIEYRTQWGEMLKVVGNASELGDNAPGGGLLLGTDDGVNWRGEAELHIVGTVALTYHYEVVFHGETVRSESLAAPRTLAIESATQRTLLLRDRWRDTPAQSHLYSSAFTKAWMAHPGLMTPPCRAVPGIIFKVCIPCPKDQRPAICGNQPVLGQWQTKAALPMRPTHGHEWQVEIDAAALSFPTEYKFILIPANGEGDVVWETGGNRTLAHPGLSDGETLVIDEPPANFCLPEWKGAGMAVPVFSLRSSGSFGVGDFGDLKQMVDWAAGTGLRLVQILPICDTTATHTWVDSYPYNSISIYAIHPMYIDLRQLEPLADKRKQAHFRKLQKQLNARKQVDYEAVNQAKWQYLRLSFAQDGERTLASDEFQAFFGDNRSWLMPYAAFCYLRDKYGTARFSEWPAHAVFRAEDIQALYSTPASRAEMRLHFYVQYQLSKQLAEVSRHARSKGVALKGDIPIGISRDSVEAWAEPHYFNLDGQAGAPPDDFSANGQNWGFPTYNWEAMEQDGYAWWRRRFKKMSEYFDAYRIDHILGFFRIWEIPLHAVHGLLGQFSPALPMTAKEIRGFGLNFNPELHTRPHIDGTLLRTLFGEEAGMIKENFLEPLTTPGLYQLRPDCDTQRKIEAHFAGSRDKADIDRRNKLYSLVSNVLFVRDHRNHDLFHPRIAAHSSHAYQALSRNDQTAFNNLYNHFFYHRHNTFWKEQAMKKLPTLLSSTNMLVCGEDLGMIPACVPEVMDALHILSLEIQRMSKDPRQPFGNPATYPYLSVSTLSTHDMPTLRGWWEEDPPVTQAYYHQELGLDSAAPAQATPEICREILSRLLKGKSMLCVPSLQDWLSIDGHIRHANASEERINIPAIPRHYWRWRMHTGIEQLLQAGELNKTITGLIGQSNRQ